METPIFCPHFPGQAYNQKKLSSFMCPAVHRSVRCSQVSQACRVGERSSREINSFPFKPVLNMLQQSVQRVFNKIPSRDWQFDLTSTGIPLGSDTASRFPQASRPSPPPRILLNHLLPLVVAYDFSGCPELRAGCFSWRKPSGGSQHSAFSYTHQIIKEPFLNVGRKRLMRNPVIY